MLDISPEAVSELSQFQWGTPKNRKGLRTAARILQAATASFIEKGYNDTSLRSISKAANVDLYNVQYYFKNKENLLTAVVESYAKAWHDKLNLIVCDKNKTAEERFLAIVEAQIKQSSDSVTRGLYSQHLALAENNQFAAELLDDVLTNYRNMLAVVIKDLNPPLSKQECLRRSSLIVVFLEGYCIYLGHWIPARSEHKGLEETAVEQLTRIACE